MQGKILGCVKCDTPYDLSRYSEDRVISCPNCRREHELHLYPAYFRESLPVAGSEAKLLESEASCFHHPDKRAIVSCETCGRFLCDLCRVEFEETELCLSCFEVLRKTEGVLKLQRRRILWDNIALSLAVLPILIWFITIVTAPVALFITFRHWRERSTSIVPRTRFRYVLASIIAGLQLLGWGFFFFSIFAANSV